MPAIVALVLAAVFAAGNLLADAPDAPVREQAETQAVVVPSAGEIRPLEVAPKTRTGRYPLPDSSDAKTRTGRHPLPDSHYRWPDSSDGLQKPQHQEWQGRERLRLEERLGEWKRERALACLRGVLPDADESELESALEDAANCIKCPQVCGHLRNEHFLRRDNAPSVPGGYGGKADGVKENEGRRFREEWPMVCSVRPNWPICRIQIPSFPMTLTPNGGPNP